MVVALRAAGRLAQPRRPDGADAVGQHAGFVVLRLRAAFLGAEQQPVERRADAGLGVRVGQEVAGDLLEGEAVEGLVVVEALDDPVAVGPDVAGVVAVVADRVGEPHHVEPADRHALAVVRAGQQAVDQALVGVGRGVLDERLDLLGRGRQAGQVEDSRRIRVRRSASGEGFSPTSASRRRTSTSTAFWPAGICALTGFSYDQCC